MTREQANRAITFVKKRWPADEVEWLRELPAPELRAVLTLALMGGVPVTPIAEDDPSVVLVLGPAT